MRRHLGKSIKKRRKRIMLKTLNQNEMMSVNGGGYYVPVYLCKRYYVQGILRGSSTTYVGTEWVASGSGITSITRYEDFYW